MSQGISREETRVPMTRMRQTVAKRLKESQNTLAMLTTFNEIDCSALMDVCVLYFLGIFIKFII